MLMRVLHAKNRNGKKQKIVAVCDSDLLGKKFVEGERVLDLAKYRSFYEGKKSFAEEVAGELVDADSINLVGERAVGIALNLKLANEQQIVRIQQIPHIQIYRL